MQSYKIVSRLRIGRDEVRVLAVAIILVLLIVLSGCGNNPYPRGATARPVLYRAIIDDPKTLDPSVSYTVTEAQIVDLIYPAYFRYHYLKRDPFVLELNLGAEQPRREPYVYSVKENGRTVGARGESWTFRIKKGLLFQDDPCFPHGKGRGIKAADFIYSFRRMADPAIPCPVLSFFEDKIIGLHEYADYNRDRQSHGLPADYQRPVEGLQLDPHDPYVFRILLSQPYPQFRYLMTMHFTTPIPHEAPERYGQDFARHPVGSGPYLLEEHSPKLKIVLKANPNRNFEVYPSDGMPGDREAGLLKDAGKQLPFADKIVLRVIKEGLTAWNLFLQGYLDWGATQEDFSAISVNQAMTRQGTLSQGMVDKGVGLRRTSGPVVYYFAFNMSDPVVGGYTPRNRKVRQAISVAFNAQAFIDLYLQGNGRPAQFLIPSGIPGFDPNYRNPYRQYSINKAKKLLAEAGYPGGIDRKTGDRLTIYYDNSATGAGARQVLGQIAKQFEAIGVRMEPRSWQFAVLEDKIDNREFQFVFRGWVADYPDPENFALLLYGPNTKNKGPNVSGYNSPVYNRLFEQMRSMDDGPARMAIIRHLREVAVEDCPWLYLYHTDTLMLFNSWLSNVKPHAVANDVMKYLRVDGPERARLQAEWNKPNYLPAIALVVFLILGTVPAAGVVRKRRNRKVRTHTGGTN
ncbi:MAG: ABC transporter substrate-binding protein [Armatimonadetes bacterium]|nr:ABC transporter substrate-binding protein [Armatimonadota bacterium]